MGKQFNIKGVNGLYLSNKPTVDLNSGNYADYLIEDYDFFPKTKKEINLYELKNVKFDDTLNVLYGSNSIAKSNSTLTYSQIYKPLAIIPNKTYYNTFTMYFNFGGSSIGSDFVSYGFSGTGAATNSANVLKGLRVKVFIQLGSNLIPAQLNALKKVSTNGSSSFVTVTASDRTGTISSSAGTNTGIQLTTGLNSQDCIDMRWSSSTIFTNKSTNGYGFSVDVALPDFSQKSIKTKDYKIIVKYYNIGIIPTSPNVIPSIYQTSESTEFMSSNVVYYVPIITADYTSSNPGKQTNVSQ